MQHVDEIDDALSFEILPPERPWRPYELHPSRGVVCVKADWSSIAEPRSLIADEQAR